MCFNVRPTAAVSGFVSPSRHLSFIGAFFIDVSFYKPMKISIHFNTNISDYPDS